MDITKEFQSNYVAASDIIARGGTVQIVMSHVTREELPARHGGTEWCPVLYFQGAKKGLVLNKTNTYVLVDAFGKETEQWVNRGVELYTVKTQNSAGQMVDGTRIRVPQAVGNSAQEPLGSAAPATPTTDDPLRPLEGQETEHGGGLGKAIDDSIPFAPSRI